MAKSILFIFESNKVFCQQEPKLWISSFDFSTFSIHQVKYMLLSYWLYGVHSILNYQPNEEKWIFHCENQVLCSKLVVWNVYKCTCIIQIYIMNHDHSEQRTIVTRKWKKRCKLKPIDAIVCFAKSRVCLILILSFWIRDSFYRYQISNISNLHYNWNFRSSETVEYLF